MIELTDAEFETIYEALRLVNHPYGEEDVPRVVAMEANAWDAIVAAKHRAARS